MSKPDTWMPLYIGDYLADTMHLSAEEHGAYLLLIMHYWRNGKIKNDATVIQQIARIKPSRVSKDIVSTVSSFFAVEDGYLVHSRIERELSEANENKEKRTRQTEAARQARQAKPEPSTPPVTEIVTTTVTATPLPSPSPSSEDKSSSESSGAKAPPAPKATRLPKDWELSEELGEWAEKEGFSPDEIIREAEKFKDFWHGKAGKDAAKADWPATWRNWIRRKQEGRK